MATRSSVPELELVEPKTDESSRAIRRRHEQQMQRLTDPGGCIMQHRSNRPGLTWNMRKLHRACQAKAQSYFD